MSLNADLLRAIRASHDGLTLTALLDQRPSLARRTAQRVIAKLIEGGEITALGHGKARRYIGNDIKVAPGISIIERDAISHAIPLSADRQDILAYIDQPLEARKPVGYQRDFLDSYVGL